MNNETLKDIEAMCVENHTNTLIASIEENLNKFWDTSKSTEEYARNIVKFFRKEGDNNHQAIMRARRILRSLVHTGEDLYGVLNNKTMTFKCASSTVSFLVTEKQLFPEG